jgi:hypothetical protein
MALKTWFTMGGWLLALVVRGQLSIGAGTEVNATGAVTVISLGNFENRSSQADLSSWNIVLAGVTQSLLSTAPVSANSLTVNGGGVKGFTGTWTISNLTLTNGVLTPQSGSRLIYTGAEPAAGSDNSYINGTFYNRRSGRHFFPIGTATDYLPASLAEVAGDATVGMSVVAGNPALSKAPTDLELEEIWTSRYWKLDVGQGTAPATVLALSVKNSDDLSQGRSLAVVEAVNEGGTAVNLSSQSSDNPSFISSANPISPGARVFTLARLNTLIPPTIHNAITPNNDGVNDFLVIRDIRFYAADNKVTLLDRWGVVVKQWVNFRGFDPITNPPDFDFAQLSNGNYICTMEYTANGKKENVRQMITVVK